MSMFNTQVICVLCVEIERTHPDYNKAHRAEMSALQDGNRNFEGIGLPKGYGNGPDPKPKSP